MEENKISGDWMGGCGCREITCLVDGAVRWVSERLSVCYNACQCVCKNTYDEDKSM